MGYWHAYMGIEGGGAAAVAVADETERHILFGTALLKHTLYSTSLERHTLKGATP